MNRGKKRLIAQSLGWSDTTFLLLRRNTEETVCLGNKSHLKTRINDFGRKKQEFSGLKHAYERNLRKNRDVYACSTISLLFCGSSLLFSFSQYINNGGEREIVVNELRS